MVPLPLMPAINLRKREDKESLRLQRMRLPLLKVIQQQPKISQSLLIRKLRRALPTKLNLRKRRRIDQRSRIDLRLPMVMPNLNTERRVRLPLLKMVLLQLQPRGRRKRDHQRRIRRQLAMPKLQLQKKRVKSQSRRKRERETTIRTKTLQILMVQKSQSTAQKVRKLRRPKMGSKPRNQPKRAKKRPRRRSQKLQRILFTRIQWTLRRRESSSLSGKNIATETGERDLVRLLSLLRLRFQPPLKNFLSLWRRKLSILNKSRFKIKLKQSLPLLKR